MSLLEELAKSEQIVKNKGIRVGFHGHLKTGSKLGEERARGIFKERGFKDLVGILDRLYKSRVDIIHITNFSDHRAEEWTSPEQLELARKAGYEVEQGEYYTFFKKDGIVKGLGKSQEVPTTQGHALFAGVKRGKDFSEGKSLRETIKQADDGELKIADHPGVKIKGQEGVLATSKNQEEDASLFDAFERNSNFYFPFYIAYLKALFYEVRYNKPLVSNSDDHDPKDIDNSYNIFNPKRLKYSSQREFRDSINESVRSKSFKSVFRPVPPFRIFHHAFMAWLHKSKSRIKELKSKV
jgi:hypothetical protein